MHRTRINISLSEFGISKAIDALKDYDRQLQNKCAMFVDKLADIGIATAKLNCGDYGNVITFSKQLTVAEHGANGKLVAVGTPVYRLRGGEVIEADPLLLAEFGSGWNAKVLDKVDGVGQGTFPGQTHAFDPNGWWYTDIDTGESHHSYGETPTFPMHSASIAMILEINRVAKEVFGNG